MKCVPRLMPLSASRLCWLQMMTLSTKSLVKSFVIKVNSFQLLKLINDILDFSDFENDNITFNIRPYDAVKLCREASETVSASRKLEVELRYDTELSELMIDTDDARLRQVLINLLVNATKFTKEGSIVLKLELSDPNTASSL